MPLFLDDNPRVTVMEIRAKARRIKARYGALGMIAIDYLQLMRGRQRYDIFCGVCHDSTGGGRGMIVRRGFKQPPPLYEDRLLAMPAGYFYDVIANGFGLMSSYARPLTVEDRWAVVAYIRTLQLARTTREAELPATLREELHSALEAAEVGYEVFLVEKNPYLGGRVAQLNQYFPKLCPPTCGLEINFRRIKDNPLIKVMTLAEVTKVAGAPGDYDVQIKINPRYVNENCTACGECEKAVQAKFENEFNYGLGAKGLDSKRRGAYLPHKMAHPQRYVIDPAMIGTPDADKA